MPSKFQRSRRWRLLAPVCSIALVATTSTRADDTMLLADLSTHTSAPSLRPPENDGSDSISGEPPATSTDTAVASASLPQEPMATLPPISPASSDPSPSVPAPGTIAAPDAAPELAANTVAPSVPSKTSAPDAAPVAPSPNVTINLLNLMVKRNLISKEDADGLIRQAQQEADVAKAQTATAQATAERALTAQQTAPAQAPAPAPSSGDDEVRVAYVPDVVKKQITDQVTQNVMEQTREEHLADTIAANQVPDWVKRFHVGGDVRLRYEFDQYPTGNTIGTGNFVNFNAINTGSAFDVNPLSTVQPPQYNVDQNRNRFRLRARLGAEIDLGSGFTSGLRIATGSDNNPVTENQTFGQANGGQGGDFSKYQVWLDRAYIGYEWGTDPDKDLTVTLGRFDNPFFHTTMLWANDLAFDGAAVQGKYEVTKGVTPFLVGGAFPVFNTDFNFSTDQAAKFQSEDKYLFAVQGGTTWQINKDFSLKGAGAFYDFENIQGKVSDPITTPGQNFGDTDDSRPSFAQNGNTYIALRDFEGAAAVAGVSQPQYFGLATPFRVAALTAQLDYSHFDPFHISITAEFITNTAFDRNAIMNSGPGSNPGPQNNVLTVGDPNSFVGGSDGYMVHLDFGKVVLQQLGDWNVQLSYRYVQSDATVDGFTDSDFGGDLTGTNLKGYTIGGNVALSPRVWAGLRWMSADAVAGPAFNNDLIQFDLNAKF